MPIKPWPLLVALALVGCEMAPVNVTPVPDVAAVRVQNDTTKKHIARTRQSISKSQEEQIKERASLEAAKNDLDALLGKRN